ncbi:hypothetical protein [Tomitella cavernea]|uniref:hypothetical protein n=1 Tax=Tomitella cavernea TaxID=1387982 RepID=UPI0019042E12|nr:hypothetical protein [Tomitella cavernea]
MIEVQCHDLEFDTSVVLANPYQSRVRRFSGINLLGLNRVDHVHRMGLPDSVASSGAVPPDLPVHPFIVAQNSKAVIQMRLSDLTIRTGHAHVVTMRPWTP